MNVESCHNFATVRPQSSPFFRLCLSAILLLATAMGVQAQKGYSLQIVPLDVEADFLRKDFKYDDKLADSTTAHFEMRRLLDELHTHGYIGASIDSLEYDSSSTTGYLYVGIRYTWLTIGNGNIEEDYLRNTLLVGKGEVSKHLEYSDIIKLKEKIIQNAEDNGYPFAEVYLDSIWSMPYGVGGYLFLDKHDFITIDTIELEGQSRISRNFLQSYLGIKPDDSYNEAQIKKIDKRITDLPYLNLQRPTQIKFYNDKAVINLALEDRNSSRFNFLIGVLPNSNDDGKLTITGDAEIELISPFGTGKEIYLNWEQLQPRTQKLEMRFRYPYIVGLPLGANVEFSLYKRDSLYLDLEWLGALQYQFSGTNYFEGFVENTSTLILTVDTGQIKASNSLPNNIDVSYNTYGIGTHLENLNYRNNPVKGYILDVKLGVGSKKIKKNNTIVNLQDPDLGKAYDYLYDSLELRTTQYQLGLHFSKFWGINGRNTLLTRVRAESLIAQNIFDNEKYRIGGANLLRGFNEEAIITPYYAVFTLEYRYLLSQNSYFHGFFDFGLVEDSRDETQVDTPLGFGAGLALETKAGIFGISYALGRQLDNTIEFRSAKIHFGYVNYF